MIKKSNINGTIYNIFTIFKNFIEMEPMRSFLLIVISMSIGYAFEPIPNFLKKLLVSNTIRIIILILTGSIYNYPLNIESFLWIVFFSFSVQFTLEAFRNYDTFNLLDKYKYKL